MLLNGTTYKKIIGYFGIFQTKDVESKAMNVLGCLVNAIWLTEGLNECWSGLTLII